MNNQNTEKFLLPAGNRKRQRILMLAGLVLLVLAAMKIDDLLWRLFSPAGAPGLVTNPLIDILNTLMILAIWAVLIRVFLWLKALWDVITAWTRLPESPETGKP